MLSVFRIVGDDVAAYLMQLFYFYFYYIYMHFAQPGDPLLVSSSSSSSTSSSGSAKKLDGTNSSSSSGNSLESTVAMMRHELFVQSRLSVSEPQIATIKRMHSRADYLACISERVVAAESLVFLARQLERIFPLIHDYLTNSSGGGENGSTGK